MRLIDADALRDELARCSFMAMGSTAALMQTDTVLNTLDAAPTIPTTTTNNGVTSCAFCGGVVDIEYPEESDD